MLQQLRKFVVEMMRSAISKVSDLIISLCLPLCVLNLFVALVQQCKMFSLDLGINGGAATGDDVILISMLFTLRNRIPRKFSQAI